MGDPGSIRPSASAAAEAWKAVKKRVHGDMAARELLMGAYRQDADEIEDWRDPNEATFQATGAEAMSFSELTKRSQRSTISDIKNTVLRRMGNLEAPRIAQVRTVCTW